MAQTPAQSFYLGPFVVYTSPTGITDPITGIPSLGGTLHEGDYVDLTADEAAQWNVLYGANLYPGRYRLARLSPNAVSANTGFGLPVGWGLGISVAQVIVAAAGTGYTITATGASTGTVAISSSAAGGTAATANITLSAGVITAVQLTYPGANQTSVPTFTLSSVLSSGSGGSILARQSDSPNFVSTLDSSSVSVVDPRGVMLTAVTAAQIAAGAWIVIQESGIANVQVTTATNTALPLSLTAANNGAVTSITATGSPAIGFLGYSLDVTAAAATARCVLRLPLQQG